jgi:hypothetical protein
LLPEPISQEPTPAPTNVVEDLVTESSETLERELHEWRRRAIVWRERARAERELNEVLRDNVEDLRTLVRARDAGPPMSNPDGGHDAASPGTTTPGDMPPLAMTSAEPVPMNPGPASPAPAAPDVASTRASIARQRPSSWALILSKDFWKNFR